MCGSLPWHALTYSSTIPLHQLIHCLENGFGCEWVHLLLQLMYGFEVPRSNLNCFECCCCCCAALHGAMLGTRCLVYWWWDFNRKPKQKRLLTSMCTLHLLMLHFCVTFCSTHWRKCNQSIFTALRIKREIFFKCQHKNIIYRAVRIRYTAFDWSMDDGIPFHLVSF